MILGLSLALAAFEALTFFSGVSMFDTRATLLCTFWRPVIPPRRGRPLQPPLTFVHAAAMAAHCGAAVGAAFVTLERRPSYVVWYIFAFCRCAARARALVGQPAAVRASLGTPHRLVPPRRTAVCLPHVWTSCYLSDSGSARSRRETAVM